ncbi:hypothetical protein CTAYLR_009982 [Chrysophaeum taylorii]|uniref:Uncharacterized protein n=1 Tax=Chrysophaeum taylorii TaxID=2483200 RepID=A0AAD7XMT5_9STRA|nr:hypothetical protein CTAYLR_009982 [Chrysophaeum taylorii]
MTRCVAHKFDDGVSPSLEGVREAIPKIAARVAATPPQGYSVYKGLAGAALALLRVSEDEGIDADATEMYGKRALELAEAAAAMVEKPNVRVTFLEGAPGVFAVLAACRAFRGDERGGRDAVVSVLAGAPWALDTSDMELMYGRAGYLHALSFCLNRGILSRSFCQEEIRDVMLELPRDLFKWHGKFYLGAAHGAAGVARMLAKMGDVAGARRLLELTDPYRLASGNVQSSTGNESDRLVHWCHGAPGFVEARLAVGDMEGALEAGGVVWRRGLLATKGPGLCHGIPGNGAALLALYNATRDPTWLRRAQHFGAYAAARIATLEQLADAPLSLFEGSAGAMTFFLDLLAVSRGGHLRSASPYFDGYL